jgi:hypothetical protein
MSDAFLADLVTAVHLTIVIFMIFGMLVVPVGGLLRWRWVRNMPFRLIHLAIMGYIVFNAIRGELCFLTYWELDLRQAAGQVTQEDWSFVGRILHDILFVDVDQAVLHWIYAGLGALVVGGMVFVPPRRKRTAG